LYKIKKQGGKMNDINKKLDKMEEKEWEEQTLKELEKMSYEEKEEMVKIQLDAIRRYCLDCAKKKNTTVDECDGNGVCPLYECRFGVII